MKRLSKLIRAPASPGDDEENGQPGPGGPGRGPLVQRLRLYSGLILFGYVCLHYINHSLGHVSLAAMEAMLVVVSFVVGSLPGQILLYGSLATHVSLGLWKLTQLRTWRLPIWHWTQILLGLAIPWFLISHIVYTRAAEQLIGVEIDYARELALLWPGAALKQSILLLLAWLHGVLGLHFWLRMRDGYTRWFPLAAGFAIALPALAGTGWIAAARKQYDQLLVTAELSTEGSAQLEKHREWLGFMVSQLRQLELTVQWIALALIGMFAIFTVGRWIAQQFGARIKIDYGNGVIANCTPGHTLLEISRANGVPHMSVCGGRARCSTCRTLIISGKQHLTQPAEAESNLLARLSAPDDIRLACQVRVNGDIGVRPLIQAQSTVVMPRNADPLGWGVEREVAVFFLDIRGFSRISERSLPYDVVFILNSFFAEIGSAVEGSNGYIDKFMGDGMMALFGLNSTPGQAARDALRAAVGAHQAAASASRILTQHLREPLRIGIGVDIGEVVVGRIGKTSDQTNPSRLTAIGDAVNIAARLEASTKELAAPIVVSARTLERGGVEIADDVGERHSISVHNISEPVDVVAIAEPEKLPLALNGGSDIAQDAPYAPPPQSDENATSAHSTDDNEG